MRYRTLFFITLCCFPAFVFGQAGNFGLDQSFAVGGILIDRTVFAHEEINDLKIQADGKIVAYSTGPYGAYLTRYLPDGTRDTSFAKKGSYRIDSSRLSLMRSLPVLNLNPDGKIIFTGSTVILNDTVRMKVGFISRLNSDGTIDSAFGINGARLVWDHTERLHVTPGGDIFTAGKGSVDQVLVSKFTENGAVDSSFGTNGLAQIDLGFSEGLAGLSVLPTGRVVIIGGKQDSIIYMRLLPDGKRDSTFHGAGISVKAATGFSTDAIIFPNGEAIVGTAYMGWDRSFLTRLKANGTIDSSFGLTGNGNLAIPGQAIFKLLLMDDSRMLCAGRWMSPVWNDRFALARTLKDGKGLDITFGDKGVLTTKVGGNYGTEGIYACALQPDGKIVAGGICQVYYGNGSSLSSAAIARYLPDAQLGIEETAQPVRLSLIVYPNPSKTSVTVITPAKGRLQLYSVDGRLLVERMATKATIDLDVSLLPSGAYPLLLQAEDMIYIGVIKKE